MQTSANVHSLALSLSLLIRISWLVKSHLPTVLSIAYSLTLLKWVNIVKRLNYLKGTNATLTTDTTSTKSTSSTKKMQQSVLPDSHRDFLMSGRVEEQHQRLLGLVEAANRGSLAGLPPLHPHPHLAHHRHQVGSNGTFKNDQILDSK